jgi:hypothetical protein
MPLAGRRRLLDNKHRTDWPATVRLSARGSATIYSKNPASFRVPEDVCVDRIDMTTARPSLGHRPSKEH